MTRIFFHNDNEDFNREEDRARQMTIPQYNGLSPRKHQHRGQLEGSLVPSKDALQVLVDASQKGVRDPVPSPAV